MGTTFCCLFMILTKDKSEGMLQMYYDVVGRIAHVFKSHACHRPLQWVGINKATHYHARGGVLSVEFLDASSFFRSRKKEANGDRINTRLDGHWTRPCKGGFFLCLKNCSAM